jgi:hypothetical protein
MTSIIINSFYRALCKINDFKPIKEMDMKQLATYLMDELYPEDGYITLEDSPRASLRVHLEPHFLDRVRDQCAKGIGLIDAMTNAGFKAEDAEPPKQEVVVPVAAPEPAKQEPPKPKPAPKPKLTPEEKAAKEAADKLAKEEKAAADKLAKEEKAAADKLAKEEKAAADKLAKEEKAAAEKLAKEEAKKIPKPKFVGNLEKLNPTQEKTWKKVAADAKVELTDDHKKRFLVEMNALDNKIYNLKKLEEHMAEFFAPKPEPEKTAEEECVAVEYKGKEYWVNKDGVVYETETMEDGSEIDKKIGQVGMAYFAEMEQPEQ